MKLICFLLIAVISLGICTPRAAALPGDLDPSFGVGGKVVTAVGSGADVANAVVLQSDGKLVVAGSSSNGSNTDFAVVRYNSDGTLDTTFHGSGTVTTDFGGSNDVANGVALQSDGKIIAVGFALTGSSSVFVLARYFPDGSLDTSFGPAGTGLIKTTIGQTNNSTQARAVKVQPDGKILVAGYAMTNNGYDFVLVRYNSVGTLDTGFGTGGLVTTDAGSLEYGYSLALQSDGKIIAGGSFNGLQFMATRYNADGTLDSSFGTSGRVLVAGVGSSGNFCYQVAVQNDGKVVLAGSVGSPGTLDFRLVRLTANGAVDAAFGTGGVVSTGVSATDDAAFGLALQGDGKLVAAGYAYNANTGLNDFAVVRYNGNGSLDTSFQGIGNVTSTFSGGSAVGTGVVIGSDGRIVVAGYSSNGAKNNFALAQYFGAGTLATTTPVNGSYTSSSQPLIGGRADPGFTVNVYLDGNVIGTTLADGSGAWSFAPPSALTDGIHAAAVTETDGMGNTSSLSNVMSFTVDTVPPAAPIVVSPAPGTLVHSSWPVISGTAEAGAAVRIYFDNVAAGTAFTSAGGNWSFTPAGALGNGLHTVKAIATDLAGNAGEFSVAVTFSTVSALFGGPGDLDPSFGGSGKVITAIGSGADVSNAVVMQSDGKLVVAGSSSNGSNNDFAVARYNTDGTLDTTFNGTGKVTTDFGGGNDIAYGVALQGDGKIIAAGGSLTGSSQVFALARYNPDGSLDTSFGSAGTGKIKTTIGQTDPKPQAHSVKVQADGKVLVAGYALTNSGYDFVLLRYNGDGTLDIGFGTGGLVTTDAGSLEYGYGMALQSDGKIVVGGSYNGLQFMAVRYNTDGTLDSSFGTNGRVLVVGVGSTGNFCYQVAVQSDGKVVLAGSMGNPGALDFRLVRLTANGALDATFGTGGVVNTGIGTSDDVAYGLALQDDGKLVAAGYSYDANTGFNDIAVVRYNSNGSLDTSFQGIGKATTSFSGGSAVGTGVVVGSDGRIVVAGYSSNGTKNNFAIAQYFGAGTLATAAPMNGSYSNNSQPVIGGRADPGFMVNIYVDGSLIGTAFANGSGAWSFTPPFALTDGIHVTAVTETDTFGDTGPLSNTVSFTVDTAAPAAPVLVAPADGTLVHSNWPVISGTAEAGATVTIFLDGTAAGNATASVGGNWSFTPVTALPDGAHTVKAAATDRAANSGMFSGTVTFSTVSALFGGPGDLDPSLGAGGKVITAIGSGADVGNAVVMQSDGKLVVAGCSSNGSNNDFAVARYNTDGTLDTTFNGTGMATTDFGGSNDVAYGVALQGDGKIIAAGGSLTGSSQVFALARYNPDGTLDTSFGSAGTGKIKTAIGQTDSKPQAHSVKVQADGKILVAGFALTNNGYDFVLMRYNNDGTLDIGFGTGGLVTTDAGSFEYGYGLALQSDGKIIVGGSYNGLQFMATRYNTDGTPDTGFGTGGNVFVVGTGSSGTFCYQVAVQNDGKVVLAGSVGNLGALDFRLVRLTANGALDATFGTGGVVNTGIGTADDVAYGLALQEDGKLVAAGYAYDANTGFNDFAVVRYNSNGSLDTSFQSIGKTTTSFSGGSAVGTGVVIGSDGRIVVTGYSSNGTKNDFAVARYFGTNQPPMVETGAATGIVRTGGVLNGSVNPNSLATTAHFEYGLDTNYGNVTGNLSMGSGHAAASATTIVQGLTDNTLYHYRLVATNSVGTTNGGDAIFITAPNPPLAFTGAAAAISSVGATLLGVVLPNARVTTVYFEYGLTTAYGLNTMAQIIPADGTIVNVIAQIAGLIAGATYHFNLVAINGGSPIPILGGDMTFQANDPPPIVTTGAASQVTTTSAQVVGTVNAVNTTAQVFFDYWTDADNTPISVGATPAAVTGSADTAVSATLRNLDQGIIYHYRVRAFNDGGSSVGTVQSFSMQVLSGFTQIFPGASPDAQGVVIMNMTPANIRSGWRFVGENSWRQSGVPALGLTTGDREVEFRPVPGYQQPLGEVLPVTSGGEATILSRQYSQLVGSVTYGGLSVVIQPAALAAGSVSQSQRAQWRFLGDGNSNDPNDLTTSATWRDSGTVVSNLFPGNYLVECKPVTGRNTPRTISVTVQAGQTTVAGATYLQADAAVGTPPGVLPVGTVPNSQPLPYAFVGQVRSDGGAATGFIVKPGVVATAGHVVFDDGSLSYVTGLTWSFQRERDSYEPVPLTPAGTYTFTSYAGRRAAESNPGVESPNSQNVDVTVLFFLLSNSQRDAGFTPAGGGYSGYLASDAVDNEWLESSALKVLVGYPVDGITASSQGKMFATSPANIAFSRVVGTDSDSGKAYALYTTTQITSYGGNSGGPLCVQNNSAWFPAGIYLGGAALTTVRAIDSDVIALFQRAETSADGGPPSTGGGITYTQASSSQEIANRGFITINITGDSGQGSWQMKSIDATSLRRLNGDTISIVSGNYIIHFLDIPGYATPADVSVSVTVNLIASVGATYTQNYAAWSAANLAGVPAQNATATACAAGDGVANLLKYAFNLLPTVPGTWVLDTTYPAGGGTPLVQSTGNGASTRLSITFVQRTSASAPGLNYYPEFSSDLQSWTAGSIHTSTDVDGTGSWFLVTAQDPLTGLPKRYSRVRVVQSQ